MAQVSIGVNQRSAVTAMALIVAMAVVVALLAHFHDRFWWPVDEGVYAYVAQRILAGDRMHRDLIDLHGGYGNLINALALHAFGMDLVSLRYPLIAATALQSVVVFAILRERGAWVAAVGAVVAAAFSFIQFPNPSANWYALLICFVAVWSLQRCFRDGVPDLFWPGFLVGLCFFTRQLSAVVLAMGIWTWLLLRPAPGATAAPRAARLSAIVIGGGLVGYVVHKGDLFGAVWAGCAPLCLAVLASLRSDVDTPLLRCWIARFTVGALVAALPLVVHHASEDALGEWLRDLFSTPLLINGQAFISARSYSEMVAHAIRLLSDGTEAAARLSAAAWLLLFAVVPVVGLIAARRVWRSEAVPPILVVAPFWGMVALHYQIPIYLFFMLPVVLVAVCWAYPVRWMMLSLVALSAWAVAFQAAQPLSRGIEGTVSGRRIPLDARGGLPRASIAMEAQDQRIFAELLRTIEAGARPGEPLMTLPMDPELNFMTGRRSPVPYYGTPLGLRNAHDVEAALRALDGAAPLFVVHRRGDKYLTPLSAELLEAVRAGSPAPRRVGPFDLYRFETDQGGRRPGDR